jgi:hypothetical protein
MSTFRNPVGPQPPQVYWRRRLVVGLGLLVVILVVLLIVFRPGSGAETAKPATAASDSGSADSPAAGTDGAAPPVEEEGQNCAPANIQLEAITDKTTYNAGEVPSISMRITNTGTIGCLLNAGTTQQVYQITSGEETYWLSTDCQTEPIDAPVLFEPAVPQATAPITWDRTRSAPETCADSRPAVPAGGASYHLTVKLGEIESDRAQFLLY